MANRKVSIRFIDSGTADPDDIPVAVSPKPVDLLPYLHPKRKAVELSGPDGGAVEIDTEQIREKIMRRLCPEMFATDNGEARAD